jgi:hypothetical protein
MKSIEDEPESPKPKPKKRVVRRKRPGPKKLTPEQEEKRKCVLV